jgi:hypothetical protein
MHVVALGVILLPVRDIHEVYRMFGEMICGTHMVYMGAPECEEATFLLLPRATSCI